MAAPGVEPPDTAVDVGLPLGFLNRHGLIAGATGTGKTRSLQLIAEQASAAGCAVFAADMKGDLAGIGASGEANEAVAARAAELAHEWTPAGCPVELLSAASRRRPPGSCCGKSPGSRRRAAISSASPRWRSPT
jgi:uncharacterized protein